jgi:hypothetical protein
MSEIDPIEYGKLIQKVDDFADRMATMETKVTAMYEMMTQAKGGWKTLLAVGTIAGAVAGVVVKIAGYFHAKTPL